MGEDVAMKFTSIGYRHHISNPTWYNPMKKRKGAGVSHIDLTISKGEIIGLVGTNGAGKTTLLRMISGILPLEHGEVTSNGKTLDIDALRSLVGFMPEQVRWSSQQTIQQTMTEFAHLRGCSIQSALDILNVVGLKNRMDSTLDALSQGMRQRLSLGIALLGTPSVLVLDEPFNGMDPSQSMRSSAFYVRWQKKVFRSLYRVTILQNSTTLSTPLLFSIEVKCLLMERQMHFRQASALSR